MPVVRLALFLIFTIHATPAPSNGQLRDEWEQALELQKKGDPRRLRELIPKLRHAGTDDLLARALVLSSEAALTQGDYPVAVQHSLEATELHRRLGNPARVADDWNQIGLANSYQGDYQSAIAAYEKALAVDRELKDVEGEIVRFYNLGNVYFEQGRYQEAYRSYRGAVDRVEASAHQP